MDKNVVRDKIVAILRHAARNGYEAFRHELKTRLDSGADPLFLSVAAWRAKVDLLKGGFIKIPVGMDACPLCLSHLKENGFADCYKCEYSKFYEKTCNDNGSTYQEFYKTFLDTVPGQVVTNDLVNKAVAMLRDLQNMQDECEARKDTNMKTKLVYTPTSGGLETIEVDHLPDLQEGHYRLRGATATIRVTHGFTFDDFAEAVAEYPRCNILMFGAGMTISAETAMRFMAEMARRTTAPVYKAIDSLLPGCSLPNKKRIVSELMRSW